jgi:hypothetical protein
LAAALGLPTEVSGDLAEGCRLGGLALVRALADDKVALCTHGDVISDVLVALADDDGLDLGPSPGNAKGSAWVLEGDHQRFVRATYVPA